MKTCNYLVLVTLVIIAVQCKSVCCQHTTEYQIQIDSNGSATWIITDILEANASGDTLEEFEKRVIAIIEATKSETKREMDVDLNSMLIKNSFLESSIIVEYQFYWRNFSKFENQKIIIGDVFQIEDLFLRLYGEGRLQLTYPMEYIVETASPPPDERDDFYQRLLWLDTDNFVDRFPIIILEDSSADQGFLNVLQQNLVIIAGFVIAAVGGLTSFYAFKLNKRREEVTNKTLVLATPPRMEGNEEKIVRILRSHGGSLHQSAIVDECRFSKAKVSQLLSVLEERGVVRRQKLGRDKIVTLVETMKE